MSKPWECPGCGVLHMMQHKEGCWHVAGRYVAPPASAQPITSDGGSTSYYAIPEGTRDCLDLIEHLGLGFGLGNAFKAFFRLGGQKAGSSRAYNLRKIIFFAQRELEKEGENG